MAGRCFIGYAEAEFGADGNASAHRGAHSGSTSYRYSGTDGDASPYIDADSASDSDTRSDSYRNPGTDCNACADCNAGKSSRIVDDQPVSPADERSRRWAAAMAQAAAEARGQSTERDSFAHRWREEWDSWPYYAPLPSDWRETLYRFLDQGLTVEDLHELICSARSSLARDEFRYFCGCCWTRLRQYRERAYEILGETP